MIKYRPHRGGLKESMAEMREFETTDEMKQFVADEYNKYPAGGSSAVQADETGRLRGGRTVRRL